MDDLERMLIECASAKSCRDCEAYIRWLEASLLCPMIQFSIAPWRILSEENDRIVKKLITLRKRYTPYISELAKHAAENREPILRHVCYEFPNQGYETERGMYMLGKKYLVVPMLKKGKTSRMVTLPEGSWLESDGTHYTGGITLKLEYPLERLYVFERLSADPEIHKKS